MTFMDDYERKALELEIEQDRRFRDAGDKLRFFNAKERRIAAGIEFLRAISKTYTVNDRNNRE